MRPIIYRSQHTGLLCTCILTFERAISAGKPICIKVSLAWVNACIIDSTARILATPLPCLTAKWIVYVYASRLYIYHPKKLVLPQGPFVARIEPQPSMTIDGNSLLYRLYLKKKRFQQIQIICELMSLHISLTSWRQFAGNQGKESITVPLSFLNIFVASSVYNRL